MRIEYEYEGNDYTAYVGVAGPEETTYALIGEQLDTHNLGCGFISFSENGGDLDVYVTGYNSAGKTENFKDDAVAAVSWHYPFLTPDMLEVVPKESIVTIFSIYYATPEGKVFLNDTPIILHSCSEVRIRDGVFIPVPVSPYPDALPEPGTGAAGSVPIIPDPDEGGGEGGGGSDGGGDGGVIPDPDYIEYPIWILSYPDWIDPNNYLISEHEYYESLDGALNKLKSRAPIQLAKRTAYYIGNRPGATFTGEYLVTVTETASINKSFTPLASLTSGSYLEFIKNPSFMQRITISGQFEVPTSDVEPLQWLGDSGYTLELKVYGPNDYAYLIANNTVHS